MLLLVAAGAAPRRTWTVKQIDETKLKLELVRRGLTQRGLAAKLAVSPSTLNGWVKAAHPAPEDLCDRIEKLLALPPGDLTAP